jgi:two-component system nitrogen regulation response regulator GlnG
VRRIAVLYPQEVITADLIKQELQLQQDMAPVVSLQGLDLSETIEQYLNRYFNDFGDELPPPGLYHRIVQKVEKPLITACLTATRGNQLRAAELLGLNRNTLRDKIRKLDIKVIKVSE